MSDIDAVAVDSLKALDPEWPIREAEVAGKGDKRRWLQARLRAPHRNRKHRAPYCLGEKRVATLALLTFTALSG